MKRRILVVSDASFAPTGYGTYTREMLTRLYKTGKYELCELACYCDPTDPKAIKQPWKFVANMPANTQETKEFVDDPTGLNKFGQFRFEQTCLDFKPDIVWTFRDWADDHWIPESPFFPYFHWCDMPTVDAEPLHDDAIDTYMKADSLFCYNDWSVGVLARQGGKVVQERLYGSAPPGFPEVFKPVKDKIGHKGSLCVPRDSLIIGTVMRNQPRKLFADLAQAFRMYLDKAPKFLSRRSYLYLHTGFIPDTSWNIPRILHDNGICSKTLFTYTCSGCKDAYPDFYTNARAFCRKCGSPKASLSSSENGVSDETLAKIYNLFDFYCQYATNEGFGMSVPEAAACGVMTSAIDYSAMTDTIRKVGGLPLKVGQFFTEAGSQRKLALPDNEFLVDELIKFMSLPMPIRQKRAKQCTLSCKNNYGYEKTAKKMEEHFDSVVLKKPWNSPKIDMKPIPPMPNFHSEYDYTKWCIQSVDGRDFKDMYLHSKFAKEMFWHGNREQFLQYCKGIAMKRDFWEEKRVAACR